MNYRIAARRVYWRWFGEVDLAGGPTLRMSGDAARWLRPGDVVQLRIRGGAAGNLLDFDDYVLEHNGRTCWPPFQREVHHALSGNRSRMLFGYRLRFREARHEQDYEAIVELELQHAASATQPAAVWRCPDGSRVRSNDKPRCKKGNGRLQEILGSTPASRFLIAELVDRKPYEPTVVAYLRLDPPLPAMHRRAGLKSDRRIRETVFPQEWFQPTFDPKALQLYGRLWENAVQEALDGISPAAARIARLVVHPDYRSSGLGVRTVRIALEWVVERGVPDGRAAKELVLATTKTARYHPFLEKAGFRYLWDTVSDRPVLTYPLSDASARKVRRFLQTDPYAVEQGGVLYRTKYGRVRGLADPIVFHGVDKAFLNDPNANLTTTMQKIFSAFDLRDLRIGRPLLRGIRLRFEPGTVQLLWGTNRAGKAMLLRLLWDEMPDSGWVDVPEGKVKAFLPGVTEPTLGNEAVLERVARQLQNVPAAVELLCRLGLADASLWRASPHQLAPHQQERLRLALLFAARPDLLLIGNFAEGQSEDGARWLARAVAKLVRETGMTLVISSDRQAVREALEPDRIVYVGYGSVWSEPGC